MSEQVRKIHINIDDPTEDKIKTAMEILTIALVEVSLRDENSNPAECFRVATSPFFGLYGCHYGALIRSGRDLGAVKLRGLVDMLIKERLDSCEEIVNKHIQDNK